MPDVRRARSKMEDGLRLAQKRKGPAQWPAPPQLPALAFGNDRWRRGLALAVVRSGLCGGRDAQESKRRCRQ